MIGCLTRLAITALGLLLADALLPGIHFDGAASLWLAALLLGLTNAFIRPLVILATLPLTLLTLGLFIFVINGLMLLLVAWVMPSFHIAGLWTAILGAIIIGLTGWIANGFVGNRARIEVWTGKPPGRAP